MISSEFRSLLSNAKFALILETLEKPAPPLGLPKKMALVLVNGTVRKVPMMFFDQDWTGKNEK